MSKRSVRKRRRRHARTYSWNDVTVSVSVSVRGQPSSASEIERSVEILQTQESLSLTVPLTASVCAFGSMTPIYTDNL